MTKSPIAQRVHDEVVVAMKAKDRERLGVLRMLQAAIKQREIDGRRELDDAEVTQTLTTYARKVKEQIDSSRSAERPDLATKAEQELTIVREFLPAELTEAELEELVKKVVADTGAQAVADLGRVMKAVMPQVAGRADGGRVSAVVKRLLSG